jgi:hypothetical protein
MEASREDSVVLIREETPNETPDDNSNKTLAAGR